jgi:hypothetical protein
MNTYTLLVKVPVIAPPTFDGTRDTSVDFQAAIDILIDDLLEMFEIPRLVLPDGSREGWTRTVLESLDLPGEPPQMDLFG